MLVECNYSWLRALMGISSNSQVIQKLEHFQKATSPAANPLPSKLATPRSHLCFRALISWGFDGNAIKRRGAQYLKSSQWGASKTDWNPFWDQIALKLFSPLSLSHWGCAGGQLWTYLAWCCLKVRRLTGAELILIFHELSEVNEPDIVFVRDLREMELLELLYCLRISYQNFLDLLLELELDGELLFKYWLMAHIYHSFRCLNVSVFALLFIKFWELHN